MGYTLKSARYLALDVQMKAIQEGDVAVDATMGNGHDTLLLSQLVGQRGRVYAFDIQEQALMITGQLLQKNGMESRARLIHAGHERMKEYVKEHDGKTPDINHPDPKVREMAAALQMIKNLKARRMAGLDYEP